MIRTPQTHEGAYWQQVGTFSFYETTVNDFDLNVYIKNADTPLLLAVEHDGPNNHTMLFWLSRHINTSYIVSRMISYLNGTFNMTVTGIGENIIRIRVDQTRAYSGKIFLLMQKKKLQLINRINNEVFRYAS